MGIGLSNCTKIFRPSGIEIVTNIPPASPGNPDPMQPLTEEHHLVKESLGVKVKLALDPGKARRSHVARDDLVDFRKVRGGIIGRSVTYKPATLVRSAVDGVPHVKVAEEIKQSERKDSSKLSTAVESVRGKAVPERTPKTAFSSPALIAQISIAFDSQNLVLEKKHGFLAGYDILNMLGRGSYGRVMKVRDKKTGVCYALKIIKRRYCRSQPDIIKEMEILRKLVRQLFYACRTIRTSSECMSSPRTRST